MYCKKKCFSTRREAKKRLKLVNKKIKDFDLKNVYYCNTCCAWHLSSMGTQKYLDLNG